jgi:hypothetical protein
MSLTAKLVVVGGEVKSAEIKLRLPSTIGRGRGATIMLPHPLVSRQHCELFETNGRLMVRDLGSLNGTFVNNERISEATLPPGELLTVGAVTFRAVYDVQEASGPPTGAGPQLRTGHSRDTDPNGTRRAEAAAADSPASVPQSAESTLPADDFDFEMPLTPVDEAPRPPTDRAPVLPEKAVADKKSDVTVEVSPQPKPTAASRPTVPARPAATPAAPKPAAPAPESGAAKKDPTEKETVAKEEAEKQPQVDFSKWDQEEEESPPAGHEDDDFGDFLKSLGTK